MARTASSAPPESPPQPYPRDALYRHDGPLNPIFATETIRTMMRALPFDPDEPEPYRINRMYGSLCALSGMFPRDEVEMMYAVGAILSFHAGAASFRIGMNGALPNGENTRHITTAGTAIRTFDSMIKGLERRQARPMDIPPGGRDWSHLNPGRDVGSISDTVRGGGAAPHAPPISTAPRAEAGPGEPAPPERAAPADMPEPVWTAEMVADVNAAAEAEAAAPLAIEGVQPDGSIVVPENPTPEQQKYIGRRLLDNLVEETIGGEKPPDRKVRIPPIRPGDLIP